MMSKKHETTTECWCNPNEYDGVVVHRDDLDYATYELTLIGGILVDYDGMDNSIKNMKKLCDEVMMRARRAVTNLSEGAADVQMGN